MFIKRQEAIRACPCGVVCFGLQVPRTLPTNAALECVAAGVPWASVVEVDSPTLDLSALAYSMGTTAAFAIGPSLRIIVVVSATVVTVCVFVPYHGAY